MKRTFTQNVAIAGLLAGMQLATTGSLTAAPGPAPQTPRAQPAPTVVSSRTQLSADETAKYQQRSAQSRQVANGKAAGASGNKTAWVVVGVAAVAGAIALASGGGGGGGGGGY